MQTHHAQAVSVLDSRNGCPANNIERRRAAILELESRVNLKQAVVAARAVTATRQRAQCELDTIHPDVQYLYDECNERVIWGRGDAAVHMLLAVERGWEYLESSAVTGHPEMSSLNRICKDILRFGSMGPVLSASQEEYRCTCNPWHRYSAVI